jgi:adenylate kinase
MSKQLVILIAPPGAGKGTQANLIAEKFGLKHLETSEIIEDKFKNSDPNDEVINKEKAVRLAGGLMSPPLIMEWLMKGVQDYASKDRSLVLSGSPRTLYEVKNEMPEFEKIFGRENIKIFYITLSEKESIERNSNRRVCQANRHPIPDFQQFSNITVCPQDGSPLVHRDLDKPEIIKERFDTFWRETKPVLDYFNSNQYKVIEINGEQPIEKVFDDIIKNFR